jgi:membrane associated rhomboid family serine protease
MTDLWSLTSAALHGEPWRLWTAYLVHDGPSHFFPDSLALVPPLLLLHPKHRMRTIVWALAIGPLISLALLATVPAIEYRGSSALAVTIWILGPLLYFNRHPYSDRRVPAMPAYVLLGFCIAKLILETSHGVTPIVVAHGIGALAAIMTFIYLRAKITHTAIRRHAESRLALSQRAC